MKKLLLALPLLMMFSAHAQERISQDPHDSLRSSNQALASATLPITGCLSNTQDLASKACPNTCMVNTPIGKLPEANSCDTREWECRWPRQAASRQENCPAGWSGNLTKDVIYEVQDCGQKLVETGEYTITGSNCTRDRTEVSQTTCPTEGGWTGSGITKTRVHHESLGTDLSTTTIISTSPWSAATVECKRIVEKELYSYCPIASGNRCSKTFLQSTRTPLSNDCPAQIPDSNMEVTYVTQHLANDLVSPVDEASTSPEMRIKTCPPVDGICGSTVNGQNLTSAPSGNQLCTAGNPTAVVGKGPWTWSCLSPDGGKDSPQCRANTVKRTCPPAITWADWGNQSTWPVGGGTTYVTFAGLTGQLSIRADSNAYVVGNMSATYHGGRCSLSSNGYWTNTTDNGSTVGSNFEFLYLSSPQYYRFVSCVVTQYLHDNFDGYGDCDPGPVTGNAASPLKVNLGGSDALLNSSTETSFFLTLRDGRILEGHVTGGLNPDEGWLMVHRTAAPLVLKNGAINADNWFGDRDHRSINGYTDLAETFSKFIEKDQYGERYIPLKKLTNAEKNPKKKPAPGVFTNPSYDLRVVDANGKEHFASDYFTRINVDYVQTVEGDGPDGKSGNNLILERGLVQTIQGEFRGAVDQWFILDILSNYHIPEGQVTRSKVHPAPSSTTPIKAGSKK